jgi:hypothetical protein
MSENILFNSDECSVTFEPSDAISDISNPVDESNERENKPCRPNKIVSLVSSLQKFECLKECGGYYVSYPFNERT